MFLAHNNNNDRLPPPLLTLLAPPSSQGASAFYDSITRPKEGGKRGRKKEVEKRSSDYVVHGIQGAAITDSHEEVVKKMKIHCCAFEKATFLKVLHVAT